MFKLSKSLPVVISLFALSCGAVCDCAAQEDVVLAWNRADKYVQPDFESFFPDDEEAGKVLDGFDVRDESKDLAEVTGIVRAGLRRTSRHQTTVLSHYGNRFIWGKKEQPALAMELMYHASDAKGDTAHYALYFGLTVANQRSDNLIRLLVERFNSYPIGDQKRIAWGFKTYGDRKDTATRLEKACLAIEADPSLKDRELAILAALNLYESLTGKPMENASRFKSIGTFVIGFSHEGSATVEELRSQLEQWSGNDQAIKAFVVRKDRGVPVGVALMTGLGSRDQIQSEIEGDVSAKLVFSEIFKPSVLRFRQLREFAVHLPGGLPDRAKPKYAELPENETFAWNSDTYRAPDFFKFFPDDQVAGKALDEAFKNREDLDMTSREILELIQRGLRHTKVGKNQVMSWVDTVAGWPSDPFSKEIAYHALDTRAPEDWRYNAIYFGARSWKDRSRNVLRALAEILINQPFKLGSDETRSYVEWGLRNSPEEKEFVADYLGRALDRHANLTFEQLYQMTASHKNLTERLPSSLEDYGERGAVFFAMEHSKEKGDALLALVQSDFGGDELFLDAIIPSAAAGENAKAPLLGSVLVVVKGVKGLEWLKAELQKQKGYRPWFVGPIVPAIFETEHDAFKSLKKFLEEE